MQSFDVTLPSSLEFELEAPLLPDVTEVEMTERLRGLQARFGRLGNEVDRPIQRGDAVVVSWLAVRDNTMEYVPGSAAVQHGILITEEGNAFQKVLHRTLSGQTTGSSVQVPMESACYFVYIHSVHTLTVPNTKALAKGLELEDETALFALLHEETRLHHQQQWQKTLLGEAVGLLVQKSRVEIPESWVDAQLKADWEAGDGHLLHTLAQFIPLAARLAEQGFAAWAAAQRDKIRHQLYRQCVLQRLIEEQRIPLPPEALTRQLAYVGDPVGLSAEQVWERFKSEHQEHIVANQVHLEQAARWWLKQGVLRQEGQRIKLAEIL